MTITAPALSGCCSGRTHPVRSVHTSSPGMEEHLPQRIRTVSGERAAVGAIAGDLARQEMGSMEAHLDGRTYGMRVKKVVSVWASKGTLVSA